ncbi:MAG: SRPBCC family protein [Candidatus Binatia bacterium]
MAVEIRETFQVRAPIAAVWAFVMDPRRVVTCLPGAELEEIVDDRTFVGSVKVKVGAITASYKGRVRLEQVDEQAHTVQMLAEGKETGGGLAKGTMSSRMRTVSDGQTEVVAEASVDLTGRIMQVGRGMIQGVSQQLFKQFVARLQEQLAAAEAASASGTAAPIATMPAKAEPLHILPVILRVAWEAVVRFFRRLLGRPPRR